MGPGEGERDAGPGPRQRVVRAVAVGHDEAREPGQHARAERWERLSRIRYTTASSRLTLHTHQRFAAGRSISRHHVSSAPTIGEPATVVELIPEGLRVFDCGGADFSRSSSTSI